MTERHEITCILQRELARMPELFGTLEKGSPGQPAVVMESVHYFFKEVAGKPLIRPAWFYDVRQEGESIPDVGTHLVDIVQWVCFPDQRLDWRKDIKVRDARRWSTRLTPEQFKRSTGLGRYPDFFKKDIGPDGALEVYANGEVAYALRGVHAKVTALWKFEAPPRATPYTRWCAAPAASSSSSRTPSRTINPHSTLKTTLPSARCISSKLSRPRSPS
jgi:hypothetical protein